MPKAKTAKSEVAAPAAPAVVPTSLAYKGFDKNWQCRGYQYAVGQTYDHPGEVRACGPGFHACENPLEVFGHYAPADSVFAVVELSGELSREVGGDSKVASARIEIKAEMKLPEIISAGVAWIMARLDKGAAASTNTGDRSASTNTGDRSASTNTGAYSASTNTGAYSASTNTGAYSASTNTGDRSASTNTGDRSASTNTGHCSASTNTGAYSASTNTGHYSASTNTGDRSASTNTGDRSASTNTGDRSASTNTGAYSASTNTGHYSASTVETGCSVAMNIGRAGKARAGEGSAIVLVNRNADGSIRHIRCSKVGENGIKPDVFYILNAAGDFEEAE